MRFLTAYLECANPKFDQKGGFPVIMPRPKREGIPGQSKPKPFVWVGTWNSKKVFYRMVVGGQYAEAMTQSRECPNNGGTELGRCTECNKVILPKDVVETVTEECGYSNTKPVAKHDPIRWIPPIMCGNIIKTPPGLLIVEERERDRFDRHVAVRLRVDAKTGTPPMIQFEPSSKRHDYVHQLAHGEIWVRDQMVGIEKVIVVSSGDQVIVGRTMQDGTFEKLVLQFTGTVFRITSKESSSKPFSILPMPWTKAEIDAHHEALHEGEEDPKEDPEEESKEEPIPGNVSNEERGVGNGAITPDPVEKERQAQAEAGTEMANKEALESSGNVQ